MSARGRFITAVVAGAMLCGLALACTAVVGDGDYKVGSSCKAVATDGKCAQCLETACCTTFKACTDDTTCTALEKCASACSDSTCLGNCNAQFPAGVAVSTALLDCANSKCSVCGQGGLGDPCSADDTCESAMCLGEWCSKVCDHDTDCKGNSAGGASSAGQQNACITNRLMVNQCFPGCSTNADCAGFAATTCQAGTSTDGQFVHVCSTTVAADGGT